MMRLLVYNELIKIFSKYRTYIGFGAVLVLMPLVIWGFSMGGSHMEEQMIKRFEGSFLIVGSLFNGFLVTYITMNLMWLHIPFLVTLVAGDVVAGEGAGGTFRIYLTRPVSRLKILISKLLAAYTYTIGIVGFFMLMSLGLGTLWLGSGDLMVRHEGIVIYSSGEALWRFLLGFGFATINLIVVTSLCFMFSTLVNNGIGPMIGAMAIILVGMAISNLPIDIFESIEPWLFTSYLNIWEKAFHLPIPWGDIGFSLAVLGAHVMIFVGIGIFVFNRKDILT